MLSEDIGPIAHDFLHAVKDLTTKEEIAAACEKFSESIQGQDLNTVVAAMLMVLYHAAIEMENDDPGTMLQ
jgi:hypothetical protein